MIGGSLEILKLDLRRELVLRFRILILGKAEFFIYRHTKIFELVGRVLGKCPVAVALVYLIHSQLVAVICRQLQPIEGIVWIVLLLQVVPTDTVHGNVIAHVRDHFKVTKVLGAILQLAVIITNIVEGNVGGRTNIRGNRDDLIANGFEFLVGFSAILSGITSV